MTKTEVIEELCEGMCEPISRLRESKEVSLIKLEVVMCNEG